MALADSQVLRSIRRIRYERYPESIKYDKEDLENLLKEKKYLIKSGKLQNSLKIRQITEQINDMLYVPEYVLVVMENLNHYRTMIKKGLFINGEKYVRLLASAGMCRVNTVCFVREDMYEELNKGLENNYDKSIKMTPHKFNAYYALSSTASHVVSTPKAVLVPDCEIKMTKKVDWVENVDLEDIEEKYRKLFNKERINSYDKELPFNLFDGGGLISVEKAKEWADELELDYIPSVFIIRSVYIKGCLFTMDFRQFAREKGVEWIEDYYGNKQYIEEADIILTESQFKLCKAYNSMEEYQRCCDNNYNYWGIARVSPKTDDNYVTSNYQFLQVLDLEDEDVKELCKDTVDWLKGVAGLDRNFALLFMMGSLCDTQNEEVREDPKKLFNITSDNLSRALMANKRMIEDEYIRQTIVYAINKKIKEAYIGKLLLRGCFSTMIPDPYAMMQWTLGGNSNLGKTRRVMIETDNGDYEDILLGRNIEVTGLLKEGEHYSKYWNERGVDKGVSMRSPLTWCSEVNEMKYIKNEETEKWFKYLNSGIVYNVWGVDCMIHADSDFDGDISCTTDNKVLYNKKTHTGVPITYEKNVIKKGVLKSKDFYKADIDSFNSTIGQITNYSTSDYDLLYKYKSRIRRYYGEKDIEVCRQKMIEDLNTLVKYPEGLERLMYDFKCYDEVVERLKLTRKEQGNSIDKAKGLKIDPYPPHWIKRQAITDKDTPYIKSQKDFLNEICGDRKPYFFIYRYPQLKADYDAYIAKKEQMSMYLFGKNLVELITGSKNENLTINKIDFSVLEDSIGENEEEKKFIKEFFDYIPVIDYNSPMNKICRHMENELSIINRLKTGNTPEAVIDLLRTSKDITDEEIAIMDSYCKRYYKAKKEYKTNGNCKNVAENDKEKEAATFEQYKKFLKEEIVAYFVNSERIANIATEYAYVRNKRNSKSFAWELFGNYFVDNIISNTKELGEKSTVILSDKEGEINYLHNTYREIEVEL